MTVAPSPAQEIALEATEQPPPPAPRMVTAKPSSLRIAGWLAASAVAVNVAQVLVEAGPAIGGGLLAAALVGLGVAALAQVWIRRDGFLAALPDVRFGVASLSLIIGGSTVGTVVLQAPNEELFYARYGAAAGPMAWLQLHDVFGSWWFAWLLFTFAAGLVATVVHRRLWQLQHIGFLALHLGLLSLLAGGAVGSLWGTEGMVHLEVGQSATEYEAGDGTALALPFAVTLDAFAVERRPVEHRLYVVERQGGELVATRSLDATVTGVSEVADFGTVEVLEFVPPHAEDPAEGADDATSAFARLRMGAPAEGTEPEPPELVRAAVRVRLLGPDRDATLTLGGDGPLTTRLDEGRTRRRARRSDDIVNFVATVGVEDDVGQRTRTQEVRVNRPLRHAGFALFQANYDPENPKYAGLLVVHDPGMPLVNLGMLALVLGVGQLMFIAPALRRRKQRPAPTPSPRLVS